MSLAEALERAASDLVAEADAIRPANGDPSRLLANLSAVAAARLFHWLSEHEPEAAEEIAAAWAEDPRGAEPLARIDASGLPKRGRKALQRARHRLRSRGIALSESTPEPVVAKLPRLDEAVEGAFVTALDPTGARLVYLIEPNPGGGVRLFELVLDAEHGVLECEVYAANRSQARRFMRDLESRERFAAVAAPRAAVRALVARSAAAQPGDRAFPRSFAEWRSHLTDAAADAPTPGALVREALRDEERSAKAADVAAELVRKGEIGPWPPPVEKLKEVAERIRESSSGRVIVSKLQRSQQVDAALQQGIEGLLDATAAERTARCFEETAYMRLEAGERAEALACLAAADELREDGRGQGPVARALIERALGPILEALEQDEHARDDSSLLVKP